MTFEGTIAVLQNLIDNGRIPEWAKPSLRNIKETVKAEIREHEAEKEECKEMIAKEAAKKLRNYCANIIENGGGCAECVFSKEYPNIAEVGGIKICYDGTPRYSCTIGYPKAWDLPEEITREAKMEEDDE